jgi:hypothetical protein
MVPTLQVVHWKELPKVHLYLYSKNEKLMHDKLLDAGFFPFAHVLQVKLVSEEIVSLYSQQSAIGERHLEN